MNDPEILKTQPDHSEVPPDSEVKADPTEALNRQIADLKDQLLRSLAEAENIRRRAKKEIEDSTKYAVTSFAREILGVSDNFQRALMSSPKDIEDSGMRNLITGVEATARQLDSILENFGIKKLDVLGQPFDPNFHRVMMEVDDASKPEGTIVQVLQSGFKIKDRLLREALVAVTKGGSKLANKVDTTA